MAANDGDYDFQMDDELQQELQDALGDMNVDSLMEADEPANQGSADGVRRGKVISIQGNDFFVDMGGRSQGILSADQFGQEGLPEVGDTIEVTIERYDPTDGLLILSRQGAVQAATWQSLTEGLVVEGRVTGHNKGGLELDLNGIRAFMPISQVSFDRIEAEELAPFVNQRLKCTVVEVRRDERSVVVSRRNMLKIEQEQAAAVAYETLEEGQIVSGVVKTIMPYGAFVDIGGVDGLLHIGDMAFSRVDDPADVVKVGQKLDVKVLKIDREERKIGLGLKQILKDPWEDVQVNYPLDAMLSGRVTRLAEFGAFCELEPGVEGLIPISEMSFERRIGHPSEVVQEGEVVQVRVINLDLERHRIGLSIKQVGEDPWIGASVRWPEQAIVEGVVKRMADFGAFVELSPGVEALVHVSELSDGHVRMPSDVVREGQTVQAKVLSVDEEQHRISLSLKQVASDPEFTGATEEAPAETKPKKKRKKPLKGGLEW